MSSIPHSTEAEWSVVAQMLTNPEVIAEAIGSQAAVDDFYRPDTRLIYETAVMAHYAGEQVDPVSIGERLRVPLSRQWGCDEEDVARKLYEQAHARAGRDSVSQHTTLVRRLSDKRRLLNLMAAAKAEIEEGHMSSEEVSDMIGTEAAKIAAGTKTRAEIMPYSKVGLEYVEYLRRLKLARENGIELAVYTGYKHVDKWAKGIQPTELFMFAGEPGVGKSAVAFKWAEGFARRQMQKSPEKRVATLVLSLEMGLYLSANRLATGITTLDSDRLREGDINNDEIAQVVSAWENLDDLPLYWNFASNFKQSQMRALIVEGIRRHNVGLVVVDHFRQFDPDRRVNNANQEDEAKARFLKEDIAKDLNVAVVCLAHTVKMKREMSDGRPQLGDLRGSYQVAAHCDQVAFMYSPYMYATDTEIAEGIVKRDEAELLWRKNRSGRLGVAEFQFDAPHMNVRDPY